MIGAKGETLVVYKPRKGRVEVLGGEDFNLVFLDEERLEARGAVLYRVFTLEETEEIYDELYPAALSYVYALIRGETPFLEALNREGKVVYRA